MGSRREGFASDRRSAVALVLALGVLVVIGAGTLVGGGPTPSLEVRATPSDAAAAARPASAEPTRPGASTPSPGSTSTPGGPATSSETPNPRVLGFDCQVASGALGRARALMAGRFRLQTHTMRLPANPSWAENPFGDPNWQFQYNTLQWTIDLIAGWQETGDEPMLDRALFLIHDWVTDNPRRAGRSVFAWNDHATAWRALALACAYEVRPAAWLRRALQVHAQTLADPSFYVDHTNHALNQSRGLLAAACLLGRRTWEDLARSRLAKLVAESIDRQGVINEQSVAYDILNYGWYQRAAVELRHCGQPVPSSFSRVATMPDFMAYATLPDGGIAMLGDSGLTSPPNVAGTIAEYVATHGASGPVPGQTFAVYKAGFAFGRTGWGTTRPFADEIAFTARFGPGRIIHGHQDHGAVTLYGYGRRLVDDAGIFTYTRGPWRSFATGRSAHDVVTIDGLAYDSSAAASIRRVVHGDDFDDLTIHDPGYPGATIDRRVVFSHGLGWLLVDDRITLSSSQICRQLWHLEPGANPTRSGGTVTSHYPSGNVAIIQLRSVDGTRFIKGQTNPVQGWMSVGMNDHTGAVTVEARASGRQVRFVTLLIPTPGRGDAARVSDERVSAGSVSFTVRVGERAERVTITASTVTITASTVTITPR